MGPEGKLGRSLSPAKTFEILLLGPRDVQQPGSRGGSQTDFCAMIFGQSESTKEESYSIVSMQDRERRRNLALAAKI